MSSDDTTPATKADLKALERRLEGKMDAKTEEILRHFDIVAEDIRHGALGANRDEIEVLKDRIGDHEVRLQVVEARQAV